MIFRVLPDLSSIIFSPGNSHRLLINRKNHQFKNIVLYMGMAEDAYTDIGS